MEVWSRTSITTGSQAFFSAAAPRSRRASCRGVSRLVRSANPSIIPVEIVFGDVVLDRRGQPPPPRFPPPVARPRPPARVSRGGGRDKTLPPRTEPPGFNAAGVRG